MLSNLMTSILRSIRRPNRLVQIGLAALVTLIVVSPSSIAGAQQQAGGNGPQSPDATCPAGGQCFADVDSSNPFYAFINRLYQQDVVSGYPCGGQGEPCDQYSRPYYRPANDVNWQQMAKFIDNALRLPGSTLKARSAA